MAVCGLRRGLFSDRNRGVAGAVYSGVRDTTSYSGDSGRMLIGPGLTDDVSAGRLMDDARRKVRADEDDSKEGAKLARRLMVAFALSALLAVMSFVFLPKWGVHLPPMIPVLGFIVILIGVVLSSHEDAQSRKKDACACDDEGRPICCGGPRPMRSFRKE